MSNLEDLKKAIEFFEANYRGSNLNSFKHGPLYDLFPEKQLSALPCDEHWPNTWPCNGKPGIYTFLDGTGSILYIGKSSANSNVSARLSNYCEYGEKRRCKLKNRTWSIEPRYVWIVGVPPDSWFESAALEEYLIRELSPKDNIVGNR
jgi:hypothetical protein